MRHSTLLAMFSLVLSVHLNASIIQWKTADGGNGNYYEFVDGDLLWTGAFNDALSRSYLGYQGHLVTITSRAEQDFLSSIKDFSGDAWLGGSDATGGGWRWVTGPEEGQLISRYFTNWAPGEPSGGSENWLIGWWREGAGDDWNDGYNNRYRGYVVEYSVPEPCSLALMSLGCTLFLKSRRSIKR